MKYGAFALFALVFFLWLASAKAEGSNLILVANPSVDVERMTERELADYFLKKKIFWPDQTPVRPIQWIEGQEARSVFLKAILQKSEYELAQYWMYQKLQAGSRPPLSLKSAEAICHFVATVDGSIGYFLDSLPDLAECAQLRQIALTQ